MDPRVGERVRRLVGLGIRARTAVVGVEKAREAARKGTLALALVADDASPNSLDKIVPLLRAKGVHTVNGFSAASLGAIAGREATAAIGITDARLADGIRDALQSIHERVSHPAAKADQEAV